MNVLLRWMTVAVFIAGLFPPGKLNPSQPGSGTMIDLEDTRRRLKSHLTRLTVDIGERSVRVPENLARTADYIESVYRGMGIPVRRAPYAYKGITAVNVVAELASQGRAGKHFVIGAHYDSVMGTVGADDNASAVAVLLETARQLKAVFEQGKLDLAVSFVAFALEEPPVYGTRFMGSRVYARKARAANRRIDGMICLEMVGYTCDAPGCQGYPFPLMFFGYPEQGDFIGIVGNTRSAGFTRSLAEAFGKNTELPVVKLTVPFDGRILPAVRLSDHASFWDQGYRAVMVTDSAFYRNPYYHTELDTMERLDTRFMAELVKSLVIYFRSFEK